MRERSLVLIKPDAVQRRLTGRVLQRFEDAGYKILAIKMLRASAEQSRQHYREHAEKAFYPALESFVLSGPLVALVLSGHGAIAGIRKLVGATEPAAAAPGTIRGDFAHQPLLKGDGRGPEPWMCNIVHASANPADAAHEIGVWFRPEELLDYPLPDDPLHGV